MPAVQESLRNVVGKQELSFQELKIETASIKMMLTQVLQAQEEQALQEFTVTTTVKPAKGAATALITKTPPLRHSPPTENIFSTQIPLGKCLTTPLTPLTSHIRKDTIPAFKLNRDVQTIPALWKLWTVGVGGAPSVEELDRRYGSSWRQTSSERQHYSMRKTLIDEIKARTLRAGDNDFARIVKNMEEKRTSTRPPMSIDKVIKTLKAARNAEKADGSCQNLVGFA